MKKKEIDMDKYNELCDKVRSVVLFTQAFKKKNLARRMVTDELMEMIRKDALEVVNRVQGLEELVNNLCETNENDSQKYNSTS